MIFRIIFARNNPQKVMTRKIILITGGQRSGKSEQAEKLALKLSPTPIYLATSIPMDEDFKERVRIHQERRGPQWKNIEEPITLSQYNNLITNNVVLVDCITLWLTNIFFSEHGKEDAKLALEYAKKEFERFVSNDATFIFVTNEIGLGGVSANAIQRHFTDLQGWMNQFIAQEADEVTLMVSGIAVKVK